MPERSHSSQGTPGQTVNLGAIHRHDPWTPALSRWLLYPSENVEIPFRAPSSSLRPRLTSRRSSPFHGRGLHCEPTSKCGLFAQTVTQNPIDAHLALDLFIDVTLPFPRFTREETVYPNTFPTTSGPSLAAPPTPACRLSKKRPLLHRELVSRIPGRTVTNLTESSVHRSRTWNALKCLGRRPHLLPGEGFEAIQRAVFSSRVDPFLNLQGPIISPNPE